MKFKPGNLVKVNSWSTFYAIVTSTGVEDMLKSEWEPDEDSRCVMAFDGNAHFIEEGDMELVATAIQAPAVDPPF